jgi:CheY-like chemotaxis protein
MIIGTAQKFGEVMIIDDNKIDLYINSQAIKRSSFAQKILEYSSAVDALNYLRIHSNDPLHIPDVIFVDIYMPVMSGFEFMEAYDGLSENIKKHSKVYIISSSIDKQDIHRAKADANIIAFHEKPLSRSFLETIVK